MNHLSQPSEPSRGASFGMLLPTRKFLFFSVYGAYRFAITISTLWKEGVSDADRG